jgi:predicted metal-dependent peptidase
MIRGGANTAALAKVKQAVAWLIRKATLCGLCLLDESVTVVESPIPHFMATNYKKIFYNPEWVVTAPLADVGFILMHEWLHIFLRHDRRESGRTPLRWNYATDYRINRLVETALQMPVPAYLLQPEAWMNNPRQLEAEQIYEQLPPVPQTPFDPDSYPGEVGDTPAATDERVRGMLERVVLMVPDKNKLGELPDDWVAERIAQMLKVVLPWDRIWLSSVVQDLGHDYPDYTSPKRRYLPYAYLPRMRGAGTGELFVAIDVSGSIDDECIKRFSFVLNMAAARATKLTVVTFDKVIREHVVTKRPAAVLQQIKFKTGAHSSTSVVPVFDLVHKVKPTSVTIVTDGYVEHHPRQYHPTNWVLTTAHQRPEWGRCFVMENV